MGLKASCKRLPLTCLTGKGLKLSVSRRKYGFKPFTTSPVSQSLSENERLLDIYARKKARPGTIQQMIAMAKPKNRLLIAPDLQSELMVRIAHRHRDFQELPPGLRDTKSVQKVISLYHDCFRTLSILGPLDSVEDDREFVRLITEFKAKDSTTLPKIALGIKEWRSRFRNPEKVDLELAAQLDDLFTARLSIRMLIGQYCEYDGDKKGRIRRGLVVADVAKKAAERATMMCRDKFNVAPDIIVEGNTGFKLTYVQSHLHHILFELLKNSARAVVEQHLGEDGAVRRKRLRLSSKGHLGSNALPPVRVVIAGGKEDCVVKVSDEGGGIPRSALGKIWSYQYTTAKAEDKTGNEGNVSFRDNFFGVGYGVPIARVFARYFAGDLHIISTEGWGTDAYVYLHRLESTAMESLPD